MPARGDAAEPSALLCCAASLDSRQKAAALHVRPAALCARVKLEVIKAEQKGCLKILGETHMLFSFWSFPGFVVAVLADFFFFYFVQKWIFIFTSFSFNPGVQES